MNLSYYSNYVTIVEEGSLTAAARKLRIAQPALSNQIKALEAEYGARLFHRGARRLELTDAGQILYQRAKRMLAIETAARSEIASGFGGTKGTLKIGITSSFENETGFRTRRSAYMRRSCRSLLSACRTVRSRRSSCGRSKATSKT